MSGFFTKIVGVSFANEDGSSRQEIIEKLKEDLEKKTIVLQLQRQRSNPHDENAVAVNTSKGKQLGFLSKKVSETIAPILDLGKPVTATVSSITGGWPMHLGMNIKLEFEAA